MFTEEEKIRAIELYFKYGKKLAPVVRELGYPSKRNLRRWIRSWEAGGGVKESIRCQRQDYWPFWGCGRFPGLLYHSSPHCWRYILGLTAPGDNFIRRSLYHLM